MFVLLFLAAVSCVLLALALLPLRPGTPPVPAHARALPSLPTSSHPASDMAAAEAAVQWIRGQYDDAQPGPAGSIVDTILAVAAVDTATGWDDDIKGQMLAALHEQARTYAQSGASKAGKVALGVATTGHDPRDFAGIDLLALVNSYYNEGSGAFGSTNWDQAFCMLALKAAGEPVPPAATAHLAERAEPDGSWGFAPGGGLAPVDSTGLVLQALAAGGEPLTSTAVLSGVAYLHNQQLNDGGFSDPPDTESNTNSTALAVQGILAAGEDPTSAAWTTSSDNTPLSFLLAMQQPDGSLWWKQSEPEASMFAAQQGTPALAGRTFPYRASEPWPPAMQTYSRFLPLVVR